MTAFTKGYALIVGIANYQKIKPLSDAVLNDIADFSELLTDAGRCGYLMQQVKGLADQQATADDIRKGLLWLANTTQQDDTAIFFFSGHGGQIAGGPSAGNYLLPFDADLGNLEDTAIEGKELSELLSNIKAGRLLIVVDACHAGGIGEVKDIFNSSHHFKSGFDAHYYNQLSAGQGRIIIASSQSNESSWILSEMRNSLFTHYVLEALRGRAQTYHDGFIGVLDVFNYVSDAIAKNQEYRQHPLLKGAILQNFPIALYLGGQKSDALLLSVENPHHISLFSNIELVLRELFDQHQRVIIEKEFGSGFSGGRVFLIRPIRCDGTEELPAVVKLGSISLIQQEWEAYRTYIVNRLPLSIGIQKTIMPPNAELGGLLYLAAGEGTYHFQSFLNYYQETNIDDILPMLKRQLLPAMEKLYEQYRVEPAFSIQRSYDPLLPINLLIHPTNIPADAQPRLLTPTNAFDSQLAKGNYVRLEEFSIRKVDLQDGTVTLNLPLDQADILGSYTLRLDMVGDLSSYQVNQIIPLIEGIVIETRDERLQAEVQRVMGLSLDLTGETFRLADGTELPNPLKSVYELLHRAPMTKLGTIHGDLNLENILVYPETGTISLIDFAAAREDDLLHDFLRLETEIVVKLVSASLAKASLGAGYICSFYRQLHKAVALNMDIVSKEEFHPGLEKPFAMLIAIRRVAQKYLTGQNKWDGYYQGMILYMLGALKFRSLDEQVSAPIPKQVAFLGAATLMDLVSGSLCDEEVPSPADPISQKPNEPTSEVSGDKNNNSQPNSPTSQTGGVNFGQGNSIQISGSVAGGNVNEGRQKKSV